MRQGQSRNVDRDNSIMALFHEGYSHARIARALKDQYPGITRSTVSGACLRMGLKRGGDNQVKYGAGIHTVPRHKPKNISPTQKIARLRVIDNDEPGYIGPIGDFPASNCCQYIAADITPDFQMCGHPAKEGTRWCEWHLVNRIKQQDGRTLEGKAIKQNQQALKLAS